MSHPLAPRRLLVPLALASLVATACGGGGAGPGTTAPPTPVATCTFTNPLGLGADPSVVRQGGFYYAAQSRNGSIWVSRSANLSDVFAASPVAVWTAPPGAPNAQNVWAPEIAVVDGKWYIYFAAGALSPTREFTNQRTYVLEATTADPMGPWVERGAMDTGGDPTTRADDVWAIDMTVARLGGRLWAIWSGWEQNATTDKTEQALWIAPMSSPTTISGPRVRISRPDQPWEDIPNSFDLQEGPTILERDGRTFLVYSTQGSWTPDYRYGLLRLTNPADPANPASWVKSSGPVFVRTPGVLGPGHGGFTVSPDGTESWMFYHGVPAASTAGDFWSRRVIRMQPFTWGADGTPSFGQPVDDGRAIPRPAGECRP